MSKVGRNEPCPCGSGKKYKKCCWLKDDGGLADRTVAAEARLRGLEDAFEDKREELKNVLSAKVAALVEAQRWQDAELTCQELRDEFPRDPIGIERLGLVAEARGDAAAAADLYRRAVAMVDMQLEGYFCDHCRAEMVKAIRRLDPDGPCPPLNVDPVP